MNRSTEQKTLTILGFCGGNTPLVTENAYNSLGVRLFHVVKNVKVPEPDYPYLFDGFYFHSYEANSYDFNSITAGVHFGVLDAHIKYTLFHFFKKKHGIEKSSYVDLIHSSAFKAVSAENRNGLLMGPQSVVAAFSELGFGVTVKRSASVGHHANLGDFVSINPGAAVSGFVNIGEGTTIGTGATIVNNITIGKHSLIGAGSVVTKDIPDGVVAYGNPCKVIRANERWQNAKARLQKMLSNHN